MNKSQCFSLISLLIISLFTCQASYTKASTKAKAQANKDEKAKEAEDKAKVIFEDSSLKVSLREEEQLIQGNTYLQKYKLVIRNLSDKKLKVKGDIFNRVSKKAALTALRGSYEPTPTIGVMGAFGPIALGVNSRGKVNVITPFTAVQDGRIAKEQKRQLAVISKLGDDGQIEKEIQAKDKYTFSFVTEPGLSVEPKFAFSYELDEAEQHIFYNGLDQENATKALAAKDLSAMAFLENKISDLKAGAYIKDQSSVNPIYIADAKEKSMEEVSPNQISNDGLQIFLYQNIQGQPSSEAKWYIYTYAKSSGKGKKFLDSSVPTKTELKVVKAGLIEVLPATKLKPAKTYSLRESKGKHVYDFTITN